MKDKAILVMDMPDSCAECKMFIKIYNDMCCRAANNRSINYPYPEGSFKQDWCPLKPVPEKYDLCDSYYDYELGYNRCIDEILKINRQY